MKKKKFKNDVEIETIKQTYENREPETAKKRELEMTDEKDE